MTAFATPIDDVQTTLAGAYAPGQGSIAVAAGDGVLFGAPSPSAPVRVTLIVLSAINRYGQVTDRTKVATYLCTGRGVDTLTGLTFESGTDQPFAIGDVVAVLVGARTISELQAAILSDGADLATHVADTSNPHDVTAAQVGSSLAQWNAAELQGHALAAGAPGDGQVLTWVASTNSWTPMALPGPAIGGGIAGGTAARLLFVGAGPVIADDAGLTWDGSTLAVAGTITSPGSGANSEHFGAGSTSAADHSVAIGVAANTQGSNATAIGYGATSGASGTFHTTAIGTLASATQIFGTAIGYTAAAPGSFATTIGAGAAGSAFGTVIGANASAVGSGVAIGYAATAGHNASICIGAGTADTAGNQLLIGSWANGLPIYDVYIGGGVAHVNAHVSPVTYHGTGGDGTDSAGQTLGLAGGQGTGAGAGGDLVFQTAPAAGTGSAPNALVERLRITQDGKLALFGAAGAARATITGSRSDGTALAGLLAALAAFGLIIDSTTA